MAKKTTKAKMATKKKTTKKRDIQKVSGNEQLPDFMRGTEPLGTEELHSYIIPPRIKVVQKQSDDEILDTFGVGDVIVSPANLLISEMEVDERHRPTGESDGFTFTPIFFFPEWATWNPMELKGQGVAIRERTFDRSHDIARKARDPQLRFETHPEHKNLKITHVEHLNFLVYVHGVEELDDTICILSFQRSEHASGRNLASLIRMRKAPIFGCKFQANLVHRSNEKGDWWGLEISNPPVEIGSWVDEDQFNEFKGLHEEFKTAHADNKIRPDYDDTDPDDDENIVDTDKDGDGEF